MKPVYEVNLELCVVRVALLQFRLVLLQDLYVFFGPVACRKSRNFRLTEPSHLTDLQDEIGIEPEVVKEMQRVDGVFDLQLGDIHAAAFFYVDETTGTQTTQGF